MTKARRIPVFNEVLTLPILCTFIFCLKFNHVYTQTDPEKFASQIKTAKIYFVTPTAHLKLNALRKDLSQGADEKQISRIEKMIQSEKMDADSFSRALINAVENEFKIAPYAFLPDTAVRSFIKRERRDSSLIFIVRRSKTESGADALILHDAQLKPLTRPIPYFARLTGFSSFVDALFGKTRYNWKNLDLVIRKWSERLEKISP